MMRIFLAIVIIALLTALGAGVWGYRDLRQPVYHTKSGQYIEVPKGSSQATVIKLLTSQGIIKHEWPITVYLKLTGKGARFKAGEYDFPSPITPLAAIAKLERGEQRLTRLTVVEGWT